VSERDEIVAWAERSAVGQWSGDTQRALAEARLLRAYAALREAALRVLARDNQPGKTHWVGCESEHRICALQAALAIDPRPKGE